MKGINMQMQIIKENILQNIEQDIVTGGTFNKEWGD